MRSRSHNSGGGHEVKRSSAPRVWRAGTLVYTTGGLVVLFLWLLLGDFSYYLKERSVAPTLKLVLRQFNATDLTVGLLMGFLPQATFVLVSPLVSYRSDRHRGRWGRRIPFLLLPTPVALVALFGMAYGPPLGRLLHQAMGGAIGEDAVVIAILGLWWGVFEVCAGICNAIFAALFNDVVPREVIGRFWAMFRVVNLLDGIIFNGFIIGNAEAHYALIFAGIGIFYAVAFTAMCLRVKEGEYPPPPDDVAQSPLAATKGYFRECFTQPYYLWYFASYAAIVWAVQPVSIFMLYFAKEVNLDMATYGKYAALQMIATLLISYPAGWLIDRFHAIRIALASLIVYCVVTLVAFFYVRDASSYCFFFVFAGMCAGIACTAYDPLRLLLLPKIKFGQYNSALLMVTAGGSMIIGPTSGWLFDRLGHDYRYIYLFASGGTAIAVLTLTMVYRRFIALGGPHNYVAP